MTSSQNSSPLKLLAPPPVLFLLTGFIGVMLSYGYPWVIAFPHIKNIGLVLFLLGAGLARWSFATLRRHGTSGNPTLATQALVVAGPFAYSRNPIYLAMVALYVGFGLMSQLVWCLALLPLLFLVMYVGVIRREERYLAQIFGDSYLAYCARVRRWL